MKIYKRIIKARYETGEKKGEYWRILEMVRTNDISKFNKHKKIKFEECKEDLKRLETIFKFRQNELVYPTLLNKIGEWNDNKI